MTVSTLILYSLQVQYINDGSEHLEDTVVFELEFSTSFAIPQHLKMRHRFIVHISVRPKNDIPLIEVRRGALLRLAKGTKKLLPSNLFDVKDPDDDASEIAITLVSPVTGEETLSYGHIENERFPGQRQTRFTLDDLKKDNVYFVMDDAGGVTQLGLRVSDRREVGNTVVLPVETFQLQVRVQRAKLSWCVCSGRTLLLLPNNTLA